jgi:predicted transcriptional regulator
MRILKQQILTNTNRRSKLELYIDILLTIKNGKEKPTNVMSWANISYPRLQRMLTDLCSQGLISKTKLQNSHDKRTNTKYQITQKGENVINYINKSLKCYEINE